MTKARQPILMAAALAVAVAAAGLPTSVSAQSSQTGQAKTMAPKATKKKTQPAKMAQKPNQQQASRAELDAKEREQTKALNEAQLKGK